MKVLIVEDDLVLSDLLSFALRRSGFEIVTAHDGLSALARWHEELPDLVILDLNLPKLDGMSVCRQIRAEDDTPIIILSVRSADDDIVQGLALGADDYVVKPFSPRQLIARIEAVLRRVNHHPVLSQPLTAGDFSLDASRLELDYCGRPLANLTQLECRLMEALMLNADHAVPADCLIDYIWGADGGDKVMLKQLVYRLRRKFETKKSHSGRLKTVVGVGYMFLPAVTSWEERQPAV
jgi:two-component system, OmpR family, response regulator MtrA